MDTQYLADEPLKVGGLPATRRGKHVGLKNGYFHYKMRTDEHRCLTISY